MSAPKEIAVETRPVCNVEEPVGGMGSPTRWVRCRRTAVASYDGVWVCAPCEAAPPPSLAMLLRVARRVPIVRTKH